MNEEARGVKKDVEMCDKENDVLVGNVDHDVIVNVGVAKIRFGFLLDSGESFFLFKKMAIQ